jgi:hypothetical protein
MFGIAALSRPLRLVEDDTATLHRAFGETQWR